jgi:hypothetical protein
VLIYQLTVWFICLDIANEATKQFKTFEFSPSADRVDVANALWELIEENTMAAPTSYA